MDDEIVEEHRQRCGYASNRSDAQHALTNCWEIKINGMCKNATNYGGGGVRTND